MTENAVTKLHDLTLTCIGQLDERNVLTVEVVAHHRAPNAGTVGVYVGRGEWPIKDWHHSTPMKDVLCALSDAVMEVMSTTTL